MKSSINLKRILLYVLVSAGLLLITESALMSAGILLLLLLIDALLASRVRRGRHDDK